MKGTRIIILAGLGLVLDFAACNKNNDPEDVCI